MTMKQGLPVAGYQPQPDTAIDLVNANKVAEERLLRTLDGMGNYDRRWVAIARTHFEQGFMAMNRAIFQPSRITLPED